MDQHGRNVQHGPISNRAVTIKQRRVPAAARFAQLKFQTIQHFSKMVKKSKKKTQNLKNLNDIKRQKNRNLQRISRSGK